MGSCSFTIGISRGLYRLRLSESAGQLWWHGSREIHEFSGAVSFHAARLAVDGRRRFCRVDRRRVATLGIPYASRRLPDFLRHADCNHWCYLESGFLVPQGSAFPITLLAVCVALL